MIETILCLVGFHKFNTRRNGASLERCCMREKCNYREKLFESKDHKIKLWTTKRKSTWFKKSLGGKNAN